MPFIICPQHGGHGTAAVCRHIAEAVRLNEAVGRPIPVTVDYDGHHIGPIWFCTLCVRQYGIPPEGLAYTNEEGLDRLYELDWVPVCPVCFQIAGGPTPPAVA